MAGDEPGSLRGWLVDSAGTRVVMNLCVGLGVKRELCKKEAIATKNIFLCIRSWGNTCAWPVVWTGMGVVWAGMGLVWAGMGLVWRGIPGVWVWCPVPNHVVCVGRFALSGPKKNFKKKKLCNIFSAETCVPCMMCMHAVAAGLHGLGASIPAFLGP